MESPYKALPVTRYWRSAVAESSPADPTALYVKRFAITPEDRIVTAGSCFAQHIAMHLRGNGFRVLDYEPAPPGMPDELADRFGYGIYSARYGNIYAPRQLLQLAEDAVCGRVDERDFWMKDGRYYDALRPSTEPQGFASLSEAVAHREWHLGNVRRLFEDMSVFIFTFGLSEAWMLRETGRVYPTAPGTIAGDYDPALHAFHNFSSREVFDDFVRFREIVTARNPGLKILVTVSPVPLTATASEDHVLVANTYSKSVLRAAAGELCRDYPDIDYFPSYEIIASHWSKGRFYEENLRSVTAEGVRTVMRAFTAAHGVASEGAEASESAASEYEAGAGSDEASREVARGRRVSPERAERKALRAKRRAHKQGAEGESAADTVCEEVLLDAFSR